jgi:endo-1,3(4)-beta-glucanase
MRIASICGIALSFLLFFLAFARYREAMLGQGTLSKSFTFKQMTHSDTPKDLWGSVSKPYPTGAFWTNLVVKTGDSPAAVLPYGVKTVEAGVQVSYGATRRMVTQYAISDNFVADLQLSATQAYQSRAVESFDSLSVTMAYKLTGNGKYRTHLVKGSPFVTVVYDNATPVISAGLMRILDLQSMVVKGSTGSQYIVTLGNFQKWLVYCSEPVAFTWNNDALTAPSTIKGVVRVAILPLQNVDAAFNLLLKHASRYPTGATMTIAHPNNAISEITFNYKTEGAGSLMMLALPHHVSSMTFPVVHNSTHGSYHPIYSIKGKMKTIIGDMWKMQMNMPTVGWNYQLADKLTISELDEIAKNLITDVKNGLPDAVDPYTFGKQIGRMAQLALIADNLGIADVRQQAISNLQQSLTPWITGMNADTLVYDKTYGGMVTVNGLADAMADFGSGWYR